MNLKVGTNHDNFGNTIDVTQVPSLLYGLCYKLELSKGTIPKNSDLSLAGLRTRLLMTNSLQDNDELKGFKLMIAASNTWQGLVYGKWPYKKVPPIATGTLAPKLISNVDIELEESIWNYRKGEGNFDLCMKGYEKNHCKSIFDTSTFQNDTR